jgi:HK97 family phage major capsid protein
MADIIKALREASDAAGGYLVPDEFAARVYDLVQAKAVTLADLESVNMNSDVMYIPKVTSGTTAYWVAETGTISTSEMGFGRITLTAKKVASLVEASTEILEDANVSVANMIVDQMSRDLALKVDDEVLNGTGGTFAGLRYTGSYTNSYSSGAGTSSGNINLSAISKAIDAVLTDNHQFPNVGFFHTRTIGSLRILTDSSGRPIFNQETWGSPLLREGVVGTVWGVPIKPANQLPINLSVGTGAGETNSCTEAILGVSKQIGIYGNRRALRFARDYKISTDEQQYQVTMRAGFSVKYPDAYCVIKAIKD